MKSNTQLSKILIFIFSVFCFLPFWGSASALISGLIITLMFGNPYIINTKKYSSELLSISIIAMGAGINLIEVGKVGLSGFGYTFASISFTFLIGLLVFKLLSSEKDSSLLITVGTAICGGSAIAAVTPVIKPKDSHVSVALAVVFLLNAVALLIFPTIGHYFNLTEHQFGLWSALAIHDTSSVVGASLIYGPTALKVATTVKLARALWIIPVTLIISFFIQRKMHKQSNQEHSQVKVKPKRPWFILGFILASALVTFVPALLPYGLIVSNFAKKILILALFFIGLNLNRESILNVGLKPVLFGFLLWVIIASTSLFAISQNFIH